MKSIDTEFYRVESRKFEVRTKSWKYNKFDILSVDPSEPLLSVEFSIHGIDETWASFERPQVNNANPSGEVNSGEDVFATVKFVQLRTSVSLLIEGKKLILTVQDSFTARQAYTHKCISKEGRCYTWPRHNFIWYCFAGDLTDVRDLAPLIRVKMPRLSFKRYVDIAIASKFLGNTDLLLEMLVFGIAVMAKDAMYQPPVAISGSWTVM